MDTWQPKEKRDVDVLTAGPVERLSATLGWPMPAGGSVPPLLHWLFFLSATPRFELGADGHPERGGFLPPVPGRRMFGGGRLDFHAPLLVGDAVERRGVVAGVAHKNGRTGPLTVVTARYDVTGPHGLAVVEEQDLVYAGAPPKASSAAAPALPEGAWQASFPTDPVLLFRFSALTFNAHRIHYDAAYAAAAGHPGLVVHGPLIAMLLCRFISDHDGRPLRSFTYRARRPLYAGEAVTMRGGPDGRGAAASAYTPAGTVAMEARAEFTTPAAAG